MKIIVMKRERIAARVADRIEAILSDNPQAVLGMTTGSTPLVTGIYEEIIRREAAGSLRVDSSVFINPDEHIGTGPADTHSYYQYMKRNLLDRLKSQPKAWHIPIGTTANHQDECEAMENTVRALGGIDWQLMGIGINGHICFIEPDRSIPDTCYITKIAEVNRKLYAIDFGSLDAVPTHAITFGLGTVIRSREACLVAVGAHKADIVAEALMGNVSTELPATILQLHANATVLLDPEAASKLSKEEIFRRGWEWETDASL